METIHFTFRWHQVEIGARFEALVAPHFTCTKPVFRYAGANGYEWGEREVCLLRRRGDVLRGPAGLGRRACMELQEAGHEVEMTRCAWGRPLQGPPRHHSRLHRGERQLLMNLGDTPQALIVVPSLRQAVPLIASAADTAAEMGIAMVAANQATVNDLAPRLQRHMQRRLSTRWDDWSDERRCYICTPATFQNVALHDFNTVFVFGVDAALQRKVRATVKGQLRRAVRRAFIEPDRTVSHYDEFLVQAQFGPPIWPIALGRFADPRVHVLTAPVATSVRTSSRDALEQKRTHVWHNAARHRQILRLALAIEQKDYPELRGLLSPGHRLPEVLAESSLQNILILAANNEHRDSMLECLDGQIEQASKKVRQADYFEKPVISTVAQARSEIGGAQVVIRADATGELWPSKVRSLVSRYKRSPLLVVDLQDSYDERAREDADLRISSYVRLGWATEGEQTNYDVD